MDHKIKHKFLQILKNKRSKIPFIFLNFFWLTWWITIWIALIILIFFINFNLIITASQTQPIFVKRVIDGDTFVGANDKRYRFFGIDTPELSDQIKGTIAKNFLNNWINHETVEIFKVTVDIYKRDVVKVFYQTQDVGLELIKRGYAKVAYISLQPNNPFFTNDSNYYRLLITHQYQAYKNGVGFWAKKQNLWYH